MSINKYFIAFSLLAGKTLMQTIVCH